MFQRDQDNNPTVPRQALQQHTGKNKSFLSLIIMNNKIKVLVSVIHMCRDKVFFKKFDTDILDTKSSNTFSKHFLSELTFLAYKNECLPFIKYLLAKGYIEAFKNIIVSNEFKETTTHYEKSDENNEEKNLIIRLIMHYFSFFRITNDLVDKLEIDYLYKNQNLHCSHNNFLSMTGLKILTQTKTTQQQQ